MRCLGALKAQGLRLVALSASKYGGRCELKEPTSCNEKFETRFAGLEASFFRKACKPSQGPFSGGFEKFLERLWGGGLELGENLLEGLGSRTPKMVLENTSSTP